MRLRNALHVKGKNVGFISQSDEESSLRRGKQLFEDRKYGKDALNNLDLDRLAKIESLFDESAKRIRNSPLFYEGRENSDEQGKDTGRPKESKIETTKEKQRREALGRLLGPSKVVSRNLTDPIGKAETYLTKQKRVGVFKKVSKELKSPFFPNSPSEQQLVQLESLVKQRSVLNQCRTELDVLEVEVENMQTEVEMSSDSTRSLQLYYLSNVEKRVKSIKAYIRIMDSRIPDVITLGEVASHWMGKLEKTSEEEEDALVDEEMHDDAAQLAKSENVLQEFPLRTVASIFDSNEKDKELEALPLSSRKVHAKASVRQLDSGEAGGQQHNYANDYLVMLSETLLDEIEHGLVQNQKFYA
eukprot:CAMPEP_0167749166 /NCGR_PEP_ID=MMETSP0110_2-20121227/5247_1 /TAXON_ID=629695 /ORGANISM="Gymnochlora sp., Strain CCMP2014" /LENGTH=357 /DNA_ID=CAMNT_0007634271 /DNA_START=185 /DNA_END=1258 /DNA_ORIENTATION=+